MTALREAVADQIAELIGGHEAGCQHNNGVDPYCTCSAGTVADKNITAVFGAIREQIIQDVADHFHNRASVNFQQSEWPNLHPALAHAYEISSMTWTQTAREIERLKAETTEQIIEGMTDGKHRLTTAERTAAAEKGE